MIFENIITPLVKMIISVFSVLPDIPNLPVSITKGIDNMINVIFDNLSLLNFFLPINTIKLAIPLVIIIINFDHIYDLVMWVLKKIPFFGIQ